MPRASPRSSSLCCFPASRRHTGARRRSRSTTGCRSTPGRAARWGSCASDLDGDRSLHLGVVPATSVRRARRPRRADASPGRRRLGQPELADRSGEPSRARIPRRVEAGRRTAARSPGTSTAWRRRRSRPGSYGRVARWQRAARGERPPGRDQRLVRARAATRLVAVGLGAAVVVGLAAVADAAPTAAPRPDDGRSRGSRRPRGLDGSDVRSRSGTPRAARRRGRVVVAVFVIAAIAAAGSLAPRQASACLRRRDDRVSVAVFCLSWLGVFLHGAVISALPAAATRLVVLGRASPPG